MVKRNLRRGIPARELRPQPPVPGPKAKAQPKPRPQPNPQPVPPVQEEAALHDEPGRVIQDIFQNLQTPAALSHGGSGNMDATMLRRIKLEAYTVDNNITPWMGKLKTLAAING